MSETHKHKPNAAEDAGADPIEGGNVDEPLAAAEQSARALGEAAEVASVESRQPSPENLDDLESDVAKEADNAVRSLTEEVDALLKEVDAVCGADELGDDLAAELGAEADGVDEGQGPGASDGTAARQPAAEPEAGEADDDVMSSLIEEVNEACADPQSELQASGPDDPKSVAGEAERLLAQPDRPAEAPREATPNDENEAAVIDSEMDFEPGDFEDPATALGSTQSTEPTPEATSDADAPSSAESREEVPAGPADGEDVAAPARSESSPPGLDLQAVDRALADDVNDLMEGGVEAVSAALERPVEEPAVAETKPRSAAAGPAEKQQDHDSAHESAEAPVDSGVSSQASPDEALEADAESDGSIPLPDRPDNEVPAAEAATAEAEEAEDAQEPAGSEPEAVAAKAAEPESDPVEEPPPAAKRDRAAHARALIGFLGSLAVPVLSHLNYPLRLVPPRYRPLVDWFALSLVFWVPIVWILAIFVIGR